jgi:hypothetical protein
MIATAIYEQTDIPPGVTCDEYRMRGSHAGPRIRAESVALALLYPVRLLAHLTKPAPAPGAQPAALHFSPNLSQGHGSALR